MTPRAVSARYPERGVWMAALTKPGRVPPHPAYAPHLGRTPLRRATTAAPRAHNRPEAAGRQLCKARSGCSPPGDGSPGGMTGRLRSSRLAARRDEGFGQFNGLPRRLVREVERPQRRTECPPGDRRPQAVPSVCVLDAQCVKASFNVPGTGRRTGTGALREALPSAGAAACHFLSVCSVKRGRAGAGAVGGSRCPPTLGHRLGRAGD